MNIETAEVISPEQVEQMKAEGLWDEGKHRPMVVPPTVEQLVSGRIARNDPCPCGSGIKFKKCCYNEGGRRGRS